MERLEGLEQAEDLRKEKDERKKKQEFVGESSKLSLWIPPPVSRAFSYLYYTYTLKRGSIR